MKIISTHFFVEKQFLEVEHISYLKYVVLYSWSLKSLYYSLPWNIFHSKTFSFQSIRVYSTYTKHLPPLPFSIISQIFRVASGWLERRQETVEFNYCPQWEKILSTVTSACLSVQACHIRKHKWYPIFFPIHLHYWRQRSHFNKIKRKLSGYLLL